MTSWDTAARRWPGKRRPHARCPFIMPNAQRRGTQPPARCGAARRCGAVPGDGAAGGQFYAIPVMSGLGRDRHPLAAGLNNHALHRVGDGQVEQDGGLAQAGVAVLPADQRVEAQVRAERDDPQDRGQPGALLPPLSLPERQPHGGGPGQPKDPGQHEAANEFGDDRDVDVLALQELIRLYGSDDPQDRHNPHVRPDRAWYHLPVDHQAKDQESDHQVGRSHSSSSKHPTLQTVTVPGPVPALFPAGVPERPAALFPAPPQTLWAAAGARPVNSFPTHP